MKTPTRNHRFARNEIKALRERLRFVGMNDSQIAAHLQAAAAKLITQFWASTKVTHRALAVESIALFDNFMKARSPIEMMIDAACGYDPDPEPLKLTDEQKEACAQLGRDVVANLRTYYPDVVKTRPTTWPIHLRNTIASQAEAMLRDILSNTAE